MKCKNLFLLVCLLQVHLACIASRGSTDHDVLNQDLPTVTRKISVNFANETVLRSKGRDKPSSIKPIVEGYMLSSDYFLTGQAIQGEEDLFFRFKTVTYAKNFDWLVASGQFLYRLGSLATAGILPYYWRNTRTLEVGVYQKSKLLKSYSYNDYYSEIVWFFSLPWWRPSNSFFSWSGEEDVLRQVDHNLVRRFLVDLRRDFLPKPSRAKRSVKRRKRS